MLISKQPLKETKNMVHYAKGYYYCVFAHIFKAKNEQAHTTNKCKNHSTNTTHINKTNQSNQKRQQH